MLFIKLIFIAILFYYLLKSIGKSLMQSLFGNITQKAGNQQNIRQKKSGDVTIYFEEKKNNKSDNKKGEYVDYEEIKD